MNPAHHFLGTHTENMEDKARKLRTRRKMNPEKVRDIRARYAAGESQVSIAESYGISRRTVSDIWRRRYWKWVD